MPVNDYYIDNNETIYIRDSNIFNLGSGTSDQIRIGLPDVTELPGQSTWFINHVRFSFQGEYDPDSAGFGPVALVGFVAGVVPRNVTTGFDDLYDYITIKGWPLKGCFGFVAKSNEVEPFNNWVSLTRSYRPRKALVLNREQDLCWNVKNEGTKDLVGYANVELQAKRGD